MEADYNNPSVEAVESLSKYATVTANTASQKFKPFRHPS